MGVSTTRVRERQVESRDAIAWFVSPHGLGHASRASAIIAACSARRAGLHHHVFSSVPHGFFEDSLPGVSVFYHRLECDIGMVQENTLEEDVGGTIRAVERLPLRTGPELDAIIHEVAETGCRIVVSDIAPLGLIVADGLDLPGILVENFTWDWIYRAYGDRQLDDVGAHMGKVFSGAALRIQTEPVCRTADGAHHVAPVSRDVRATRREMRSLLGIPADHRMLLVSLGGLASAALQGLLDVVPAITLVAPTGGSSDRDGRDIIRIPTTGGPYHPDLVEASDLVIGKLGYSTVAEVYRSRTRFAFLRRPRFPESPILEAFVRQHIPSEALPNDWPENPSLPELLEELLARPRPAGLRRNGAGDAADLILERLQQPF